MKWIVTGAAGFIGCNTVRILAERGIEVVGIDNLSRPGAELNLEWLHEHAGGTFTFERCDIRDTHRLNALVAEHCDASVLLHLAAQVAVTTSIRDPRADFEMNALGSFNVCEAVRVHAPECLLIYASTNKVYGSSVHDVELRDGRWWHRTAVGGIDEATPLDFHSPYACSKGAGEQYVLDYARTYGLRTVSIRQSCIYGPRQFGIEDQGWVAWLTAAALAGQPFTIYGDGLQVRDLLFVDDLAELYLRCAEQPDAVRGLPLNAGGGPANALSVLELVGYLEGKLGGPPEHGFAEQRSGDQRFFVADTTRARDLLGWSPSVSIDDGLDRLYAWIEDNLASVIAAVSSRGAAVAADGGRSENHGPSSLPLPQ
jgi:CDP-paratose 2-epimerase